MTVSVLIHYFTLVAVMWMGAEAVLMFQKIVIVFARTSTRYIIAISLICWGMLNWKDNYAITLTCLFVHPVVPVVPVAISLCIDRNLLVRRNSTEG